MTSIGETTKRSVTLAESQEITGIWAASIQRSFSDHIPLYATAFVFSLATLAISWEYGIALPLRAGTFFLINVSIFVGIAVGIAAVFHLIAAIRSATRQPVFRLLRKWLSERILRGDRRGNSFHTVLVFVPLMISFAAIKDVIPKINPFSWDIRFTQWDRALAFGHLPWEILQPVLGFPLISATINLVYDAWLPVVFGCLFWQAFSPQRTRLRMQFLLAFAFIWFICGNILALIISSAGPCFYGRLGLGSDPYAPLMAYLRAANEQWPIWSLNIQNMLWHSYASRDGVVSGISAMPSMHVCSCVIMTLLGWRTNRLLGIAFTIFTAIIVIGSVHLAWHYAVDSLAAIFLAVALWTIAGLIMRAWDRFREPDLRPAVPVGTLAADSVR